MDRNLKDGVLRPIFLLEEFKEVHLLGCFGEAAVAEHNSERILLGYRIYHLVCYLSIKASYEVIVLHQVAFWLLPRKNLIK